MKFWKNTESNLNDIPLKISIILKRFGFPMIFS